jgi:hypothetical protein
MDNFSGIGSKIASWSDAATVIKQRGFSPVKWVGEGWQELGKFTPEHFATKVKSPGWMGTGDITRHLPVGPKSLMVGMGAVMAPSAFAKEDPTGQGESRARRIGGWVGSNLLGIAATLPSRVGTLPMIGLGIGGSIGGDVIGRRIGGLFEGKRVVPQNPNVRG